MNSAINAILHAVLVVFLIIELGLTAYLVSTHLNYNDATANFMLFNSVWSLIVLLYVAITPRVFARLYHSIVGLAVLSLTTLFWFAGSIAIAAKIPINCHGYHVCQVSQAAAAFGFFIFFIFLAMTVFEGLASRGGGRADKPFSRA